MILTNFINSPLTVEQTKESILTNYITKIEVFSLPLITVTLLFKSYHQAKKFVNFTYKNQFHIQF